MPQEIILLTGDAEGPHLTEVLKAQNPKVTVIHVETLNRLKEICLSDPHDERRLIAFCTGVVVPAAVLKSFPGPCYNFHPGPPTYPGSCAASFAIYDGADRFGATVHVMEPRVDEGDIVACHWFDVPNDPKLRYDQLEILAYQALAGLFHKLARHLATNDAPLPPIAEDWAGYKHTKAEAEAMKLLPDDCSEDEIRLRYRAFG